MRSSRMMYQAALCCGLGLLVCSSGCALIYQGLYGDGPKVPAKFTGLVGKRVAVVCIPNSSAYDSAATSAQLSQHISRKLKEKVKNVDMVRDSEVADWMDRHDWEDMDYAVDIGRGVKSELVVAVEVDGFSIHEGATLYKGRAQVTTTVYDIQQDGEEIFRTTSYDFEYPKNHPEHTTTVSEGTFRRHFIKALAEHVARNFYEYYLAEEIAAY